MADFSIYEELMPKIQALIAPPDNNGASNSSKERSTSDVHSHFKRRSKRHNHDYCDACGERGDVLSCDICPASFHLLCHDPPLDEKVVANGHWICHACRYTEKIEQNTSKTTETTEKLLVDQQIGTLNPSPKKATEQVTNVEKLTDMNELNLENSDASILSDTVRIKDECLEDENVVSELDESADELTPIIKTECEDEYENNESSLIFPLKTEPDTFECLDSAEENDDDVINVNMDDVWKIIGVNEQVKVIADKIESRKSSKDTSDGSKSSSDVHPSTVVKAIKHRGMHVSLPKCDHLLKSRKISTTSTKSTEERKKTSRKSKKKRTRSLPKNYISCVSGIKKIFDTMINKASKMNPKQFALPIEYTTNIDLNLIGSEKDPDSLPNDLDSADLLKLPARKCYYCKGTCLTGQMISCDFCPAHFHLNCLNPPLCSIPDVKWMCPLHPHHVLDHVMKNPSSITELMSWWSKFSSPVDDEDVKSNFIKKVKSVKKPANRKFIRSSVKIPDIVKYHYKHPPPRVPSLRELVDSKTDCVFNNDFTLTSHELIEKSNNCCSVSQETGFNESNDQIEYETFMNCSQLSTASESVPSGPKKYNLRPFKKAKWKDLIEVACIEKNSSTRFTECENNQKTVGETESTSVAANFGLKIVSNGIYPNCNISKEPKAEKYKTDLCWRSIENFIVRDINKNFITGGIAITTLSEDLRRLLLIEKIKQYTQDLPPSFLPNTNPYPLFHPLLKNDIRDTLVDRPKGNVRAVLCPLSHRPLIYMYGQSLSIGSGFSNDICLMHYGNCNFISDEHAVIFYDKTTNTYELINYSEYNTVVDGICYTCDISRNDAPKESPEKMETSPKKPIARTLKRKISVPGDLETKRRAGSTVMAAEARSIYKKLLQDIDKLVHKSQDEMNSIAEEDLNEIAKAIKNTPDYRINQKSEKKNVKKRTPVKKRNEKPIPKSNDHDPLAGAKPNVNRKSKSTKSTEVDFSVMNGEKSLAISVARVNVSGFEKHVKTRTTTVRKRRKRLTKPRRSRNTKTTRKSHTESVASQSDLKDSDEEYLLGDKFFVNAKKSKCRCHAAEVKFPNGRDGSWERTAPLNHGSYIRFGCIEFIFSIVNYPPPNEERIYTVPKPLPTPVRVIEPEPRPVEPPAPQKIFIPPKKDDLSLKLISILNVLSSKPSKSPISSSASSSDTSPASSTFSSRSSSPAMQNGDGNDRFEIHYPDEPESKKCRKESRRKESKNGKIEITG